MLSAHDHGNCELCDEIERASAALLEALELALSDQSFEQWKEWERKARAAIAQARGETANG